MGVTAYREITDRLRRQYTDDPRPWLVGYSGGNAGSNETLGNHGGKAANNPLRIGYESAQRSHRALRSLCLIAAVRFDTRHAALATAAAGQKGILMSDWKAETQRRRDSAVSVTNTRRLRELQEEVAAEKGIRAETLRRLLAKVDEFGESHRAFGLPDDLLNILEDDLADQEAFEVGQIRA
jgi:hypothetical protein